MGEEGVVEGSMGVGDGDGEVSGEGFEAVVGEVWAFAAGEREDVAGGVGGGRLVVAGASGAKEGEIESDIIADEGEGWRTSAEKVWVGVPCSTLTAPYSMMESVVGLRPVVSRSIAT